VVRELRSRPRRRSRLGGVLFAAGVVAAVLGLVWAIASNAGRRAPSEGVRYVAVSYEETPGWSEADIAAALPAFVRSCTTGDAVDRGPPALREPRAAWDAACDAAAALAALGPDEAAARGFFRRWFTPLRVERTFAEPGLFGPRVRIASEALVTGYYEPVYDGRRAPDEVFSAPVLSRPDGYLSVDLDAFDPALGGRTIVGVAEGGRLRPLPDRAAIETGAPPQGSTPLGWMRPADLFFLQVQGSGRLVLPDGETLRLGYDGKNGKPYVSIGGVLVRRGEMALEEASMQSIRAWLETHPEEAPALLRENPSYVFFRQLTNLPDPSGGPLGSEGTQLTPGRSVAIDPEHAPYGAPVFVDLARTPGASALSGLYVAQDSGGAIKGPLRADLFIGVGEEAGEVAGRLNARGGLYVLAPHAIAAAAVE